MPPADKGPSRTTDAAHLRALLGKADLSKQAAATVLEIDEADMRAYSAGEKIVPRIVILRLERVMELRRTR